MNQSKRVRALVLGMALGALPLADLRAEDTKGKWQFGFGLSYFSTMDYIRSNADIAFAERTQNEGGGFIPPVSSVDARPDINVLNEPTISDDFKIDINASYGLTRWLAIELSAGYLKSAVGNIEDFELQQTRDLVGEPTPTPNLDFVCGPLLDQTCQHYNSGDSFDIKENRFLPIGQLTEIPIQVSGLVRFRPESPLDPYVGLGVGYILTDLKTDPEFNRRAAFIDNLHVTSADKGDFTREGDRSSNCDTNGDGQYSEACSDFSPGPITARIDNAFQWHAVAGVDYYVNERFAFYVDARYVWTSGGVEIRTDGSPQVQLSVLDEGRLLTLRKGTPDTPYLWEDTGLGRDGQAYTCSYERSGVMRECAGDGLLATEDKQGGLQNALYERAEDDGMLYLLPPNSRDLADAIDLNGDGGRDQFYCPQCDSNEFTDTEDKNGNTFMDTFLLYGVDICTFQDGIVLEDGSGRTIRGDQEPYADKCRVRMEDGTNPVVLTNSMYNLWPEGCASNQGQISLDFGNLDVRTNEGCPTFPSRGSVTSTTGNDNAGDVFIIQGGNIRLGGFSLGLGFKFLF